MPSDMGSVTQSAYSAITDQLTLLNEFSTPESVLDYLQNENEPEAINTLLHSKEVFRGLSSVLKYIMVKGGICEESDSDSSFIDRLYDLLLKQDEECGNNEKRNKITVTRWLNGYTTSIRYRDAVIEICFALRLSLALSNELLNKCGYNSLNVRNAAEATYIYCLLNQRPLSAAKELISKYSNNEGPSIDTLDNRSDAHSGNTTTVLEQQIMSESNWENDDRFLATFLLPNKPKFINYSSTTVNYYYHWKNNLFITIISDEIKKELPSLNMDPGAVVPKDDLKTLFALRSALKKYKDVSETNNPSYSSVAISLWEANKTLNKKMDNALDVLTIIRDSMKNNPSTDSQKCFSLFLSDIMTMEGVLKYALSSIRSSTGRIRRYTGTEGSKLQESVMKEFPNDKAFANFEKNPITIDQGMTLRKVIILMYYIVYSYEFSKEFYIMNFNSEIFDELGFFEFMDGLNDILSSCHLPLLYPANQFDWLILRCIRQFEIGADYEEIDYENDDPIALFNRVLSYSFGDKTDEDN